jgi:hypothetical protein
MDFAEQYRRLELSTNSKSNNAHTWSYGMFGVFLVFPRQQLRKPSCKIGFPVFLSIPLSDYISRLAVGPPECGFS